MSQGEREGRKCRREGGREGERGGSGRLPSAYSQKVPTYILIIHLHHNIHAQFLVACLYCSPTGTWLVPSLNLSPSFPPHTTQVPTSNSLHSIHHTAHNSWEITQPHSTLKTYCNSTERERESLSSHSAVCT